MTEKPFFSTDAHTLYLDETLVEYNGPQLVTCKDNANTKYLVVCSGLFDAIERWVAVQISELRLQEVFDNKLTLYDAFTKPENGEAIIFEQGFCDPTETTRVVSALSLADEWLPTPGYYLDLEAHE